MKDMFYNYDHNINKKEYPENPIYYTNKKLHTTMAARKLFNVKGDELGVCAKVNSEFYLYFKVDGAAYADDGTFEADARTILENAILHFDVLNQKREVVASFMPELSEYDSEIRVQIYTSEEGPLKYGNYKMHLYFETENGIYTLFSEEDGILTIE